ncbi:hypothetical protein QYE76_071662 [Lolium multiflorum]|uniref:Transposase (putative) gypsy type domain-containing protein n=1 Tax=Lolium multiflorum TaxID=4521 RepID=A0AAD8SKG8_LOLMU|nr:hypothetical protein QYE76_071662 [Lolium multiflorum]
MPPRPKLTRHNTPNSMEAQDLGNAEWERSKISPQDVNLLKKLGISKKKDALLFPSEESYLAPPIGYRVSFVDHLIRGLSAPIHEFLRGLLFVYGLQLHHLTPNSILHIAIFITLCESFLGVHPNWALWKRIFLLRRNGSHNIAYNIGGVVICVRPDVEYFNIKFPDSVQGWRKRWLYVREECPDSQEFNIAPFDGSSTILRRRSWDAEATEDEKMATETLMTRIHELQNTRGQELSGKMSQDFVLEKPEDNRLLDALSRLDIHADLVRRSIFYAQTAFSRWFPYFFPKKKEPDTFAALAESFVPKEDLGLALRQENLKIGVEGTIALVAESQQNVDWTKVGEATKMKQDKWPNLIRAAKPHSKKILAFLGYKPTPSSSSAKTEVK